MSETTKKDNTLLYVGIYCAIAALGWIIPPVAPLTAEGMHLLAVFVAAIFGWSITSDVWPSFLTFILLPFTGVTDLAGAISLGWGNDTVLFIILVFAFAAYLDASGATSYVASFLMTRKFLQGHPWRLLFMIFLIGFLLCSFCKTIPGMMLTWAIIYRVCDLLGYKPFEKFPTILVFGVAVMGALSLSAVPWMNNALVILNSYAASSGSTINYAHYLAYSIPFDIFTIFAYLLLCKFVFRLDVERLKDLDTSSFAAEMHMTKEVSYALIAMATLILSMLIPNILPAGNVVSVFLNKLGLTLKLFIIFLALSIVKVDGKPVLNFAKMAKEIPWNNVVMIMGIMAFVSLLGNANTGISAFLGKMFTPIFANTSTIVLFVLVTLVTVFLTNFMINMVIAVIMISATLPIATTLGIMPLQIVYLITIACTIAFMLPAASAASCILYANTDWMRAKDVFKYGFPTIIVMTVLILVWNILFFAVF